MKLLIVYATTEGQTRKIVRYCADRLAENGHSVELLPAAEGEDLDLGRFDGVLLAASVHAGRYQSALLDFAGAHRAALAQVPNVFLSVSLAAAGDDPDDWKALDGCVARLHEATGWRPARVEHVAGAFRFSEYDFFKSWAMRWIASRKGEEVDPHSDTEYTDWAALARIVDQWVAGLPARRAAAAG